MRLGLPFAVAAALAVHFMAPLAAAYPPTYGVGRGTPGQTIKYTWSGTLSPSAGMKTAINQALLTDWPSGVNVDATTHVFVNGTPADGVFEWEYREDSTCGSGGNWVACSQYQGGNGLWSRTVFDKNRKWCQESGDQTPPYNPAGTTFCWDVRRLIMHEMGHGVGLARTDDPPANVDKHQPVEVPVTVTVLNSEVPWYRESPQTPVPGWDTHSLQECDVIRLQMMYGMRTTASAFPACVTEIPGQENPNGMKSVLAVYTPLVVAGLCLSETFVASGRFTLIATGYYGALSGDALALRLLHFNRRTVGGSWTNHVTSTYTTGASSGTNWSKSFASASPVTYEYQAVFEEANEPTLGASVGPIFRITWDSAC